MFPITNMSLILKIHINLPKSLSTLGIQIHTVLFPSSSDPDLLQIFIRKWKWEQYLKNLLQIYPESQRIG